MKKRVFITTFLICSSLCVVPYISSCGATTKTNTKHSSIQSINKLLNDEKTRLQDLNLSIDPLNSSELNNLKASNVLDKVSGFIKEPQFDYYVTSFTKDAENAMITFSISIAYINDESSFVVNTEKISVPYTVDDSKPSSDPSKKPKPVNPTNPKQEIISPSNLSSSGGYFNSLNVDSYLSVVMYLDLKQDTKLPTLTDEQLTKTLQDNQDMSQLTLKIADGSSEYSGKLVLELSGKFNNQQISNTKITISDFTTNNNLSFQVADLSWNYDNYFDNSQPLANVTEARFSPNFDDNNELNKKLINDAKFIFSGHESFSLSWKEMQDKYYLSQVKITRKGSIAEFDFLFQTKFLHHKDGQWTLDVSQAQVRQQTNNKPTLALPKLKDLLDFMTDKLTVNEELLSNFYGSFFVSQAKYSKTSNNDQTDLTKSIDNFAVITNKYKNIYFPKNEVSAKVNYNDGIKANDFTGTLSFEVHLHYDSGTNNDADGKTRIFTVSTKNITDFIKQNKEKPNTFKVKSGGNLGKAISGALKSEIDSWINKPNGFTTEANETISGLNDLLKKWANLFNLDNNVNNYDEKDWESLSILGFEIKDQLFAHIGDGFKRIQGPGFDIDTGLFGGYKNADSSITDAFQIRSITFDFGDSTKVSVKKENANSQTATISFEAKMKLLVGEKLIEQKSTFELSVTKATTSE